MNEVKLFYDKEWVTNIDLLKSLEKISANNCDILYIHSGLSFGQINPDLSRSNLLELVSETILALEVNSICFPTFTFSFCNQKDYDVNNSKTKMGALNEYFRKMPGVKRSVDPLLSHAVLGSDMKLVDGIGNSSIGKDSTFEFIHNSKNVNFLFLGAELGSCFTYMHYLEWLADVKYRYERKFTGTIKQENSSYQDTYKLFIRYANVFSNNASHEYGKDLNRLSILQSTDYGPGKISCCDKDMAANFYMECLSKNPYHFIQDGFDVTNLDKTFSESNMIAL